MTEKMLIVMFSKNAKSTKRNQSIKKQINEWKKYNNFFSWD